MSLHQTCRPEAIPTARQLESLPSVLDTDLVEPDAGLRASLTIEIAIDDTVVLPSVLDVLARRDAALSDSSQQGGTATIAVARV
ncbi:hypothetical protein Hbl1158_17065 (plasmid) [Halobaculum sp. CBA1158]|uniref:hypothetical protein n=1 Tax=Halobaculum sp. CBA1158 TaxID=2904243 RepID=UPI001F1983A8|nr:hypothetical protein [Halobaculum sp. CBA1158]UIP01713.1 hypothetical protein Hbl1158_17065 [Halobaculum sp. CBA1158]